MSRHARKFKSPSHLKYPLHAPTPERTVLNNIPNPTPGKALTPPVVKYRFTNQADPTKFSGWQTNRGLIEWNTWDGKPWDIETLNIYKHSFFFQYARDLWRGLLSAQDRLTSSPCPRRFDYLYRDYKRAQLEAYESLDRFQRCSRELAVISYLLRTSSTPFSGHAATIDMSSYVLSEDVNYLLDIRLIKANATISRSMFAAEVKEYQISADLYRKHYAFRTEAKKDRLRRKESVRPGDTPFSLNLRRAWTALPESIAFQRSLDVGIAWRLLQKHAIKWWNSDPQLWAAAAPLYMLELVSKRGSKLLRWNHSFLPEGYKSRRSERFINSRLHLLWTISDEINLIRAAIRGLMGDIRLLLHYRIDNFPSGIREDEIRAGRDLVRRIWTYARIRDPRVSGRKRKRRQGRGQAFKSESRKGAVHVRKVQSQAQARGKPEFHDSNQSH